MEDLDLGLHQPKPVQFILCIVMYKTKLLPFLLILISPCYLVVYLKSMILDVTFYKKTRSAILPKLAV